MPRGIPNSKEDHPSKDDLRAPSQPSTMVGVTDDMGSHDKEKSSEKGKKAVKRYKVVIHSMNGDNSDVVICHNYVCNQYKRNVEVEMDEHFLAVLKDAVVTTNITSTDGATSLVSIPQYSYTIS